MTASPLTPAIEPVAWFEYARKKPALKRLVFDRTSRSQLRVAGWVSEPLVKESDATQARADLEAENKRLKLIAKALLSAVTATGSNGKAILGKMLTDGDPDLIAAMAALKDTK